MTVKIRHPRKYQYLLDALEKMPEIFRQTMLYPILPSRYFQSDEVPAYLKKAALDGKVKRVAPAWWKRLEDETE